MEGGVEHLPHPFLGQGWPGASLPWTQTRQMLPQGLGVMVEKSFLTLDLH